MCICDTTDDQLDESGCHSVQNRDAEKFGFDLTQLKVNVNTGQLLIHERVYDERPQKDIKR